MIRSRTRRSRQRSRLGSPVAPAVAARAIPGTSGLLQPQKDGQSSSGVMPVPGHGLAISLHGILLLTKLLIVPSVLLSTTGAMQTPTNGQHGLWNASVLNR